MENGVEPPGSCVQKDETGATAHRTNSNWIKDLHVRIKPSNKLLAEKYG